MHYLNLNLKTNVADQESRLVDWLNLKGKAGYHPWLLSNSGTMAVNLLVLGILTYLSNGCQGVFFSLEISRMIPATGWSVLHLAHIQTLDELLLRSIMTAVYVIQYKAKVLAGILTFVLLMAVIISIHIRILWGLSGFLP